MGNSQVRSSIELVPEGCLPAALPGHDRGAGPASRGKREAYRGDIPGPPAPRGCRASRLRKN